MIAPPEAGMAGYFKVGTFIPVLNYRVSRIAESPYDTTIVIGEYDGWADPPDRPWNVVSLANAVMGIAFVHGPPIAAADPSTVPAANTTVRTNSLGGTVVTHLVPTDELPLTQPFRLIRVPDSVVDRADRVLRPIIDAGYRRHDAPGDPRPYFADGEIHRNVQSQQVVREQTQELVAKKPDQPQHRRNDLRDRLERGLQRLTSRISEWRQDRRAERHAERVSDESGSGQPDQP